MHVRFREGDSLSLDTTSVEIGILHYRVLQIYNLCIVLSVYLMVHNYISRKFITRGHNMTFSKMNMALFNNS